MNFGLVYYNGRHMYASVLFLHSWLRWLVILFALIALGRAIAGASGRRPWLPADDRAAKLFTRSLDLQVLLGLLFLLGEEGCPLSGTAEDGLQQIRDVVAPSMPIRSGTGRRLVPARLRQRHRRSAVRQRKLAGLTQALDSAMKGDLTPCFGWPTSARTGIPAANTRPTRP